MRTVIIIIDAIPIECIGFYHSPVDGGRDEPSEPAYWEWQDCVIGGQSMLGAGFMPWEQIEQQIAQTIKDEADDY